VGAIIIEPITANGYRQASPSYYKKLRKVAADEGIPFIVDETTIGMGVTGKMWSHEYWYLSEKDGGCADMVTFSGNTGISGFFSTKDYRTDPMCCAFDQTVDLVQLINFGEVQQEIQYRRLLQFVQDTSTFLKIELGNIERDYDHITNIRGNGTFIGFDAESPQAADSLQLWFNKTGIRVARVGPNSFGLRPALILGPSQACYLRESLKGYHPNHVHSQH
jgi:4-aminobutyrate aminotransferase-like enzyme